ncbi:MAG: hypothetical protein R3F59_28950 [Myxococcota bacterium]
MNMRQLATALLGIGAATAWSGPAAAASDDGVPLTIRVVDEATEQPITTAVVRHPQEQDRHHVNTETGEWSGSVLYMPDGSELLFEKGMTIEFEVSAPGYVNRSISYTIRRRRNEFSVALTRLDLDMQDEDPDDITIQFGRDKPID